MRITRLADIPVVMHIRDHGDTIVAVPEQLSDHDILTLARLVLTSDELEELTGRLGGLEATRPAGIPRPRRERGP